MARCLRLVLRGHELPFNQLHPLWDFEVPECYSRGQSCTIGEHHAKYETFSTVHLSLRRTYCDSNNPQVTFLGTFRNAARSCCTIHPSRLQTSLRSPCINEDFSLARRRLVVTYPRVYHAGFDLGKSLAESDNYALESWLDIWQRVQMCGCVDVLGKGVFLSNAVVSDGLKRLLSAVNKSMSMHFAWSESGRKRRLLREWEKRYPIMLLDQVIQQVKYC